MLVDVLIAIVATAIVGALYAHSRRSDFRLGQQAFRDGLRYNPRWSERTRAGWLEEKVSRDG